MRLDEPNDGAVYELHPNDQGNDTAGQSPQSEKAQNDQNDDDGPHKPDQIVHESLHPIAATENDVVMFIVDDLDTNMSSWRDFALKAGHAGPERLGGKHFA